MIQLGTSCITDWLYCCCWDGVGEIMWLLNVRQRRVSSWRVISCVFRPASRQRNAPVTTATIWPPIRRNASVGINAASLQLYFGTVDRLYIDRAFAVAGPRAWNSLPPALRSSLT